GPPADFRSRAERFRFAVPPQVIAGKKKSRWSLVVGRCPRPPTIVGRRRVKQTAVPTSVAGGWNNKKVAAQQNWILTIEDDLRIRLSVQFVAVNDALRSE